MWVWEGDRLEPEQLPFAKTTAFLLQDHPTLYHAILEAVGYILYAACFIVWSSITFKCSQL